MRRVGRFYPPDREVLKDITLAFFPGAKIGVIGRNGVRQVVAAADHGRRRRRLHRRGSPLPRLHRRLPLPGAPARPGQGRGRQRDGRRGRAASLLARYDEVMAQWAEPDADYDRIGAEQADLEARIEAAGAWDLQRTLEIAMDALRLPTGRRRRRHAVRRRAPPGGAVPAAALQARPAAARRADEPPRRRVGRLAGAHPAGVPRHRRGRHPRPLLPRQRGRLDPRARPRPGHPLRGQLLARGWSRSRSGCARRRRPSRPASARSSGSWSGCAWRPGPARPRARPACRLREAAGRRRGRRAGHRPAADPDPARRPPRRPGHRGRRTWPRATATAC